MTTKLTEEEINKLREESGKKIQIILRDLESNVPGITEGFGAITRAGIGGAASLAALSGLGTISGLAPGLATAGSITGGGMVAGIGVLAAPIAVWGFTNYPIFKHKKAKKQIVTLQNAITSLYSVIDNLSQNTDSFKDEMEKINLLIKFLKQSIKTLSPQSEEILTQAIVELEEYDASQSIENVMQTLQKSGYSAAFCADIEQGLKTSSVYLKNEY